MKLTRALIPVFAALSVSAAQAVTFSTSGGAFGNNVLFNNSTTLGPATAIQGNINSTSYLVDFTSTSTIQGEGGQATLFVPNDGTFTDLCVSLVDPSVGFTTLVFNLDALNRQANAGQDIAFTAELTDGSFQSATLYDVVQTTGSNFFRIDAEAGELLRSVCFTTDVNGEQTLIEFGKQFRIGGVAPVPVPEPASMLAMGAGFVALARRRRK